MCAILYRVCLSQKQSYGVSTSMKSGGSMNKLWNMFSGVTTGSSESILLINNRFVIRSKPQFPFSIIFIQLVFSALVH